MNNFKATERINGFIYIKDVASGKYVGAKNSEGNLKPKKFKSVTGAIRFILSLEEAKKIREES